MISNDSSFRRTRNYLIKTYSVNHPGVTTRFGDREIGLLD